jgi:hypothetical protein
MESRFRLSAVCFLVLAVLSLHWIWNEATRLVLPSSQVSVGTSTAAAAADPFSRGKAKSIYPGELPGYTGWARPATTLAGSFEMHRACQTSSRIDKRWKCTVRCTHNECRNGGSLFYVRAYGPAILPGEVTDHGNGMYDVTFLPMDEGIYTVEVVLTFSKPPLFSIFPMEPFTEPVYEGYMLPGFPLQVSIVRPKSSIWAVSASEEKASLPVCTIADLLDSGPTSANEKGRWVVREKMIDRPFSLSSHSHSASLNGYVRGDNSLGIRMEYRPTQCSLLDEAIFMDPQTIQGCLQSQPGPRRNWHILMIGDSNLREQRDLFLREALLSLWPSSSYISTMCGIKKMLSEVERELRQTLIDDAEKDLPSDYVVLFNTGLHDITFLCGNEYFGIDLDLASRGIERCADMYRQKLTEFAQMMKKFPSVMTVFQTSTAAWPKWGVYGAAWPPTATQPLPFSSDFVKYFNDIAWDVMKKEGIPVMDTYWLTYSRPDHREVAGDNLLSGKMAHAGPEVYGVLTRKWLMMMLETLCPNRDNFEEKLPEYADRPTAP